MAGRVKRVSAQEADDVDGTWDIPSHWTWQKIEDVAEINPKTSFGDLPATHPVPFIPMASVSEERGAIDASQRRDAATVQKGYTRFKSGDVIFAKIKPCMENGKIAIVPALPGGVAAGSTEFHVLRPNGIDPHFLFYFLVRRAYREEARRNMSGSAGQLRVSLDFLRNSPIPVPPPDEQHQVRTRIDALFSDIADGESALAEAREGMNTYRVSLLNATVTGELTAEWRRKNRHTETGVDLLRRILAEKEQTNPCLKKKMARLDSGTIAPAEPIFELPDGWAWTTVGELGRVTGGLTQNQKRQALETKLPFLRVANVYAGRLDLREVEMIGVQPSEVSRVRLEVGDLLIVEGTGSIDQIGRAALWDGSVPDCVHQNHLIKVRCLDSYLSHWIQAWLESPSGRFELEHVASSTSGLHTLSISKVSALRCPLPGREEMIAILAMLAGYRSDAEDHAGQIESIRGSVNGLRQSILSAAFRGELA